MKMCVTAKAFSRSKNNKNSKIRERYANARLSPFVLCCQIIFSKFGIEIDTGEIVWPTVLAVWPKTKGEEGGGGGGGQQQHRRVCPFEGLTTHTHACGTYMRYNCTIALVILFEF